MLEKSGGTTPTEQHLARLCERAFLRLWSYPNLHRDQGGGKELCDVLIVFDRDIVVFSDKSCAYPDTGDENRDWARWFRRSILDSARQVYGAERWIRNYPHRIFLDAGCSHRLPIDLPRSDEMRIHRVVVARGAGERCSAFFGGDSGSLMVRSNLVGDGHINASAGPFGVFRIGQVDPDKGYVHVLDDENLDTLLTELDTVSDFVAYLARKEALLCSHRVVLAPGEEDLLAYYLTHTNTDGEHDFVLPSAVNVIQFDHLYGGMRDDDQYIAKKSAEKRSYLIDRLIEHAASTVANHAPIDGSKPSIGDVEKALRMLAAENRLARRGLARALLNLLLSKSNHGRPKIRSVIRCDKSGTAYCFLVYPCPDDRDYDEYRLKRAALLAAYGKMMKIRFPNLQHIVGIAMEPLHGKRRSEDLMYLDAANWTEEDTKEAGRIQREVGLLASPTITHVHEDEYPASPDAK